MFIFSILDNLRIGFTEVDFSQTENNGSIIANIQKEGDLMSDLFLNIIPLTYAQFDAQNYTLPTERSVTPDPAECKYSTYKQNIIHSVKIIM